MKDSAPAPGAPIPVLPAVPGVRAGRRFVLPAFTRTVRFRLTLLYSLSLFGVASILIGGIYWGLSRSLSEQAVSQATRVEPGQVAFDIAQDEYEARQRFELLVDQHALETLRRYSMAGLGSMFVISLGVGWFTAGRVLMPIGRITKVAREIQATDLRRRIGMLGPDDELKQLADTFDAMLGRLEQAFENQQRLIHDASHELRNPLAVLRTNLEVTLADPTADLEQYRHTAEVVRRSSERMSKLVDDLLAYARHEAATRVEAPFDLSELVLMLVDEFQGAAAHEGLHFVVDVEPSLVVMGHERSMEQALANLLANAVRFAPTGSAIAVRAGSESGSVWVTVADEGPGVAAPDHERIFDRYVRLSDGEAGRPHLAGGLGSGLGLAITREIVRAHRGDVALLDTPIGATFGLWMPAHDDGETTSDFRLRLPRRKSPAPV